MQIFNAISVYALFGTRKARGRKKLLQFYFVNDDKDQKKEKGGRNKKTRPQPSTDSIKINRPDHNKGTVLPRLVRRRTVKLISFFDKKRPLILSNFLRFVSFLSRETLI